MKRVPKIEGITQKLFYKMEFYEKRSRNKEAFRNASPSLININKIIYCNCGKNGFKKIEIVSFEKDSR